MSLFPEPMLSQNELSNERRAWFEDLRIFSRYLCSSQFSLYSFIFRFANGIPSWHFVCQRNQHYIYYLDARMYCFFRVDRFAGLFLTAALSRRAFGGDLFQFFRTFSHLLYQNFFLFFYADGVTACVRSCRLADVRIADAFQFRFRCFSSLPLFSEYSWFSAIRLLGYRKKNDHDFGYQFIGLSFHRALSGADYCSLGRYAVSCWIWFALMRIT